MAASGGALPERPLRRCAEFGARIQTGVGMTEKGSHLLSHGSGARTGEARHRRPRARLTEVRLDGVSPEARGRGETLLRGPAITPGYRGDPAATANAFGTEGWFPTGDVAPARRLGRPRRGRSPPRRGPVGRRDRPAGETEDVLQARPDVGEASVIGVPDARWGEVGHAVVRPETGHCIDPESLSEWWRARLAGYKLPRRFHMVDGGPRTAARKIRKSALSEEARGQSR